jgi:thiaminase
LYFYEPWNGYGVSFFKRSSFHDVLRLEQYVVLSVYFDAWSHVNNSLDTSTLRSNDGSIPAVRQFATNWSSPEFEAFVDELAGLVDSFGIPPGTDLWSRAEAIWSRVVELEVEFWPEEGEETQARKIEG